MLKFLNIANLAVINRLQIEFRPGLNILSGETGSGKSIIIDALGLLLGERASQDMIRTGETRAYVEGLFGVEGNLPLQELLVTSGIEIEGDEIVIKREMAANGRGRIFVNNQSATLALLKAIQPHLIDIHGQGDQQSLLSADAHLDLLDAYAGADQWRRKTGLVYERLLKLAQALEASQRTESERLQMLDLIEYQILEIERARLSPHEDVEGEAERKILANAEKLATLCGEAYSLIYEDECSVLSQMGLAQRRLNELAEVDARFAATLEQFTAAKYTLEDTAFLVRDYAENINFSPTRLKELEDRLAEINRLKRKYGGAIEVVLGGLERLKARREELQQSEERERGLKSELRSMLEEYQGVAEQLGRLRRTSAQSFERIVVKELAEVALEHSRFSIHFREPVRGALAERLSAWLGEEGTKIALGRAGREEIEFYFSANAGEEVKPLSGVASGGELSRLMLVLKTVTAPTLFPRTLIFDEIDAGIGGRVSEAVGQRLTRLAETNQVLCVTHQAQIARHAQAHFQVTKEVDRERTATIVVELTEGGRIEELARMIGGREITTLARRHAKELLKARG